MIQNMLICDQRIGRKRKRNKATKFWQGIDREKFVYTKTDENLSIDYSSSCDFVVY